jgi:hypothetical protein
MWYGRVLMPKRSVKSSLPQQGANAQIRLVVRSETPSYYVNYIAVSHTAYDFTLSAVKIPSPLTQEQAETAANGNQIPVEPILQLVVPPLLVDGLIKALMDQKSRYEQTLAQQVKNNEIQQYAKPADSVH